ncbi:MAG: hypothetical protein ACRD1F_07190, partial [Terriglobales bacterium]
PIFTAHAKSTKRLRVAHHGAHSHGSHVALTPDGRMHALVFTKGNVSNIWTAAQSTRSRIGRICKSPRSPRRHSHELSLPHRVI